MIGLDRYGLPCASNLATLATFGQSVQNSELEKRLGKPDSLDRELGLGWWSRSARRQGEGHNGGGKVRNPVESMHPFPCGPG